MNTSKVRFWVWVNAGPVLLTLRPGQALNWGERHGTDEGWSSEDCCWEFVTDDGTRPYILRDRHSYGQDCDGRFESGAEYVCYLDEVAAHHPDDDDHGWPVWHPAPGTRAWQRDHSAEAAGY